MDLAPLSDDQRRILLDTMQIFEAYSDALAVSRRYRGGMRWKKSKGSEYLFRGHGRDGLGKSLGVRGAETEKIWLEFTAGKKRADERFKRLRDRIRENARFVKAARLQRVPRIVSDILRRLDGENLLGRNVIVVGTNCLYAYENAAGVRIDLSILATQELDILWDTSLKLNLASAERGEVGGIMGILQKSDRSFIRAPRASYRAVNDDGYMVDLITSPKDMRHGTLKHAMSENDLQAAEVDRTEWLLSAPRMKQIGIGYDGLPVPFVVPDPAAFALHKLWLSERRDREVIKRRRDRSQAMTAAALARELKGGRAFLERGLMMFPKALRKRMAELTR